MLWIPPYHGFMSGGAVSKNNFPGVMSILDYRLASSSLPDLDESESR